MSSLDRSLEHELNDEGHDVGRLKSFSDGVYAIVVTILVLNLKIPDLPRNSTASALLQELRPLLPYFLSYFITFFITGFFWIIHTRMLRPIVKYNRKFLFINLLHLFFVSIVPFSAAVMGLHNDLSVAWLLYLGNIFLVSLTNCWLWNFAVKSRFLEAEYSPIAAKYVQLRSNITTACMLAGVPIAFVIPEFAGFALFLIPISLRLVRKKYLHHLT